MKLSPFLAVPIAAAVLVTSGLPAQAQNKAIKRVESATETFEDIMANSNTRIPTSVLRNSTGIAIIPDVVQAGFFFGGRRGEGVLLVHNPNGSWSNPMIVNLTGGSVGLQIGAQSTDTVLVFRDQKSIDQAIDGSIKLGGSVTATAGPVGEKVVDPADTSKSSIFSYSRSRGLFGGVALSGVALGVNDGKNETLYGQPKIRPRQIISGQQLQVPAAVTTLKQTLNQYMY